MRDVFTDLTALPEKLEGEGIPPDSLVITEISIIKTIDII